MKDKAVVITGATSGLGRATALQLAQQGAVVVMIARSQTKASEMLQELEQDGGNGHVIIADLSSMEATKAAAESITKVVDRVDVLINNAGAYFSTYRETAEGFESTLALNYLSPFLLTHHLLEPIQRTAAAQGEARIINIASIMHKQPIHWDDLNGNAVTYQSTAAYEQSKHLLISFTYYLSRQLKETGITVNCIHPGFVKTALAQSDFPFPMSVIVPVVGWLIGETPAHAADTPVWLALSHEVKGITGEYVHHRTVRKSWPPTRDETAQTRLYQMSQRLLDEWLSPKRN